MNYIIFKIHRPNNFVNGALIDIFDHFLTIKNVDKSFKILIISQWHNKKSFENQLINILNDRYLPEYIDLIFDNVEIIKSYSKLIYMKFDNVLLLDYETIKTVKAVIQAKKIVVISDLYTDKPEYFISHERHNVIYYGEMPFVYHDIKYNIKIPFQFYNEINEADDKIYLTSPQNNELEKLKDQLIIDWSKVIYKSPRHLNKLFTKFNHFIYYHNNTYFDPRPRLFMECKFYNKSMEYHNIHDVQDGSYYRWNDISINGLNDRYLTEDDMLIQEFKI